tara:strand:+ start:274 stop:714 length:441 start_codon:yes stop_codon:yes gene_type:complete
MKKLLLLVFLYALPLNAQPIVPSFTTGTVSSTTNTTTSINETITSTDYHGNSYEYTVTGLGVTTDGSISPNTTNVDGTINGQTQTWTGLDLSSENKPVFTLTDSTSGNAFQFTETYRGPGGVSNVTTIQRNIESQSVITSTSVFSQ